VQRTSERVAGAGIASHWPRPPRARQDVRRGKAVRQDGNAQPRALSGRAAWFSVSKARPNKDLQAAREPGLPFRILGALRRDDRWRRLGPGSSRPFQRGNMPAH